jgi:hypothetical protein
MGMGCTSWWLPGSWPWQRCQQGRGCRDNNAAAAAVSNCNPCSATSSRIPKYTAPSETQYLQQSAILPLLCALLWAALCCVLTSFRVTKCSPPMWLSLEWLHLQIHVTSLFFLPHAGYFLTCRCSWQQYLSSSRSNPCAFACAQELHSWLPCHHCQPSSRTEQ